MLLVDRSCYLKPLTSVSHPKPEDIDMTKQTISRALLSLAISTSIAFTAANAGGKGFILDESIHDYSYDASRSFPASSSRQGWGGYDVKTILDEAYHDYYGSDVAAFESPEPTLEQAEFAAFEEYSYGVPSVSFTD